MYFSTYTTFYIISSVLKIVFICCLGGLLQYLEVIGNRIWTTKSTKVTNLLDNNENNTDIS